MDADCFDDVWSWQVASSCDSLWWVFYAADGSEEQDFEKADTKLMNYWTCWKIRYTVLCLQQTNVYKIVIILYYVILNSYTIIINHIGSMAHACCGKGAAHILGTRCIYSHITFSNPKPNLVEKSAYHDYSTEAFVKWSGIASSCSTSINLPRQFNRIESLCPSLLKCTWEHDWTRLIECFMHRGRYLAIWLLICDSVTRYRYYLRDWRMWCWATQQKSRTIQSPTQRMEQSFWHENCEAESHVGSNEWFVCSYLAIAGIMLGFWPGKGHLMVLIAQHVVQRHQL